MKILHIDLKPVGNDYAEFRYFWDNSNDYQSRQLSLAEIKELIERAERDYYTIRPEDYAKTGQALYHWLDGSDRNLQREIDKHWREGIVLAIAATSRLAHLPWEVLHDGQKFLVERAIIPVRWKDSSRQLTLEKPENRALNVLFMATSPDGITPVLDFDDFKSDLLRHFYKQPLEGLRKADLQKKLKQLEAFNSEEIDKESVERALKLADGNPRLLEWLNSDVLSNENASSELSKFETSSESWKEKIIWIKDDSPKLKIDQSTEKVVSRCLVFEIPVPMPALEAVCESISGSGYKEQLKRAIELGLIEVSGEPDKSKRVYRVSRILPHIIPTIKLPEEPKVYSLYRKASEKLRELWDKIYSEGKWREFFRLTFANRENPDRFKQGFDWWLLNALEKVNDFFDISELDSDFQFKLIQVTSDLKKVKNNSFTQLEEYLKQNNWEKADQETLWIFYQVMAINGCLNWHHVNCRFYWEELPCDDLHTIDHLWVKYSNGAFGFSVQRKIFDNNPFVGDKIQEIIPFPSRIYAHLPRYGIVPSMRTWILISRLKKCNI